MPLKKNFLELVLSFVDNRQSGLAARPLPAPAGFRGHFIFAVSLCLLVSLASRFPATAADGPGVPSINFSSSQVNTAIKTFKVNDIGMRPTYAGMSRGYLVVAGGGFDTEDNTLKFVSLWDLANPTNPVRVAKTQDTPLFKTHAMGFSSNLFTVRSGGFALYDISNPTNPVLKSRSYQGKASSLHSFYAQPYLFRGGEGYGDNTGWISVFDLSDPANPRLVADIDMPSLVGFRCGSLWAMGNLLVVSASETDGVVTMDISDPKNPQLLGVVRHSGDSTYTALANGNRMYTGGGSGAAIFVYDFSDKYNPSYVTNIATGGNPRYPALQDNYLHLANIGNAHYQKINLNTLSLVTDVAVPNTGIAPEIAIPLGNMVFIGGSINAGPLADVGYIMVHQAAADTTGPSVNAVRPLDGEANVGLTSMIGISLTDQIDPGTLTSSNMIVRPVGGSALPGSFSTQSGIVNFAPASALAPNTVYEVIVTAGGLKDLSGNGVPAQFRSTFSTGSTAARPDGLTHLWRFENDWTDSMGNNTGTNSGATFGTGLIGQASYFDGNDSVAVGSIDLGDQFTLAAWVWIDSGSSGPQIIMANSAGTSTANGFRFFVHQRSTSDASLVFETGSGAAASTARTPAGSVPVGQWVHVAAAVDRAAGSARLFVNGQDLTSSSSVNSSFAKNQNLFLGAASDGTLGLHGRLDDARVHNTQLSAPDLLRITSSVDDVFMSHRWHFNGDLVDSIGSVNGGSNGVTFDSGKEEEAVYLHDTNYVALGLIDLGSPFTVSGWVRVNSGATNIQTIMANGNGGGIADGFHLFVNSYNTANGAIALETGNGTLGAAARTRTNAVPVDTWVHFTAVLDRPNGTARFYVNGDDWTEFSSIRNDFGVNRTTYFGTFATLNWSLDGALDDIQVFPRALTAAEAGTLFTTSQGSGLTHRWRLDDDANDSVGGNDGTLNGATFAAGRANDGAVFDGSDSISLGTLGLASQSTLAAWVWVDAASTNSQSILSSQGADSSSGFSWFVNSSGTSDGKVLFQTADGSSSLLASTAAGAVAAGCWNHCAAVIDRTSGSVRLYVNGTDRTAASSLNTSFGTNQVTWMGSRTNSSSGLSGKLDEVSIFDRKLGSGEIANLYIRVPNTAPSVTSISSSQSPAVVNTLITFTASATDPDGDALAYSFDFGDGSAPSAYSSSPTATHRFTRTGRFTVVCRARDGQAISSLARVQVSYNATTTAKPASSSAIAYDSTRDKVWNVNPDNDSVTRIDVATLARDFELAVGTHPLGLALRPGNSEVWVACEESDEIKVINAATGVVTATINTGWGSHPVSVAFAPDGGSAFVALQGNPRVAKYNPATRAKVSEAALPGKPRGLAIDSASARLFVSRFISDASEGQVWEFKVADLSTARVFSVQKDTTTLETGSSGRGVPNYLIQLGISPDGKRLWVPSKKDNIVRGRFRTGEDLKPDSTVRSMISKIDLTATSPANQQTAYNTLTGAGITPPVSLVTNLDLLAERKDVDNHEIPHGIVFSPVGDLAFIAFQGNNEVLVFDTSNNSELYGHGMGSELTPEGVAINSSGTRLFVHNFMTRTVSVLDSSAIVSGSGSAMTTLTNISAIVTEKLSAPVLSGKQIFYNAADRRMGLEGYIACATCHLDGGHDGQTWDFTDRGEGLRNTITLKGRSGTGHGRVHWSANFDEIQDFELDIVNAFKGFGFITNGTPNPSLGAPNAGRSTELDNLASYVGSLTNFGKSPFRSATGALTTNAVAGRALFEKLNCQACHSGSSFTDSATGSLHDVGTLKPGSGKRLGATLTGLDTPTLKGLWDTTPYLHDGSAATLKDVLTTANANNAHGNTALLTPLEIDQLVDFLRQIDDAEPAVTGSGSAVEPANPEGLSAVTISTTKINLYWTDKANNEARFKIERRATQSGPFVQIANLAAPNITFYQDTNLAPNVLYFYRVRASNAAGDSAYSNVASARTRAVPLPSSNERDPGISSSGRDSESVAWPDPVPGLRIARAQNGFVLTWPSRSGVNYQVQSRGGFDLPWRNLDVLTGGDPATYYYVPSEASPSHQFFRVLAK